LIINALKACCALPLILSVFGVATSGDVVWRLSATHILSVFQVSGIQLAAIEHAISEEEITAHNLSELDWIFDKSNRINSSK
jgi:hypothetical protein